MSVEDLKQKIQIAKDAGKLPMLVSITCGTTILAAYDPVEAVADICDEHGIWLHVDVSKADGLGTTVL